MCSMSAYAITQRNIVRVGISNQGFSTYEHTSMKFLSFNNILVTDMTSEKTLSLGKNDSLTIEVKNGLLSAHCGLKSIDNLKGPLVLSSDTDIGIPELNRKGTPARYGGQFEIILTKNSKFNVVNVVSMQEYLKGVVPNEMPVSFGLEALKAQAIAARNYANRDVNSNNNYDVVDSVASQVYYGVNSHNTLSDTAINETNGLYALYEREPIVALYFSTGSGITESWENVFGSYNPKIASVLPYLVSVYDDKDFKKIKSENDFKKFFKEAPESFDMKSPKYRWNVIFTQDELDNILPKNLLSLSKSNLVEPKFDDVNKFGSLKEIKVLNRGGSGKILLVEIETNKGCWKIKKELAIRRLFAKNGKMLDSANFYVEKTKKKSDKLTVFESDDEGKAQYEFYGAGFGHGVGMSQYGAGFMASKGHNYIDILKHYYTNITIGTIPIAVGGSGSGEKINFYHDKKFKVYLKIDNSRKIKNLDFYINDDEFRPDLSLFSAKTLLFDVTEFLKSGNNTIFIKPLSGRDFEKTITAWIEVVE